MTRPRCRRELIAAGAAPTSHGWARESRLRRASWYKGAKTVWNHGPALTPGREGSTLRAMRLKIFSPAATARPLRQRNSPAAWFRLAVRAVAILVVVLIVVVVGGIVLALVGRTDFGFVRDQIASTLRSNLGPGYSVAIKRAVIDTDPVLGLVVRVDDIVVRDNKNDRGRRRSRDALRRRSLFAAAVSRRHPHRRVQCAADILRAHQRRPRAARRDGSRGVSPAVVAPPGGAGRQVVAGAQATTAPVPVPAPAPAPRVPARRLRRRRPPPGRPRRSFRTWSAP